MRTAAAAPTPIPAAAPPESPEDVLAPGVDVVPVEDVGADVNGVVDAGTREEVEEVEDEVEDEDEVVLVTTL